MKTITSIDRRNFIRLSGLTGAALALGFRSFASDETVEPILYNMETVSESFGVTPFVIIDKTG